MYTSYQNKLITSSRIFAEHTFVEYSFIPGDYIHCDWFTREADWPTAAQVRLVRWENHTRRTLGRRGQSTLRHMAEHRLRNKG